MTISMDKFPFTEEAPAKFSPACPSSPSAVAGVSAASSLCSGSGSVSFAFFPQPEIIPAARAATASHIAICFLLFIIFLFLSCQT